MSNLSNTLRRSGNDMIDAFMYSIEALKIQKARRKRRFLLAMYLLAVAATAVGAFIARIMS